MSQPTIVELGRAFRHGTLDPAERIEAGFRRMESLDDRINAVIRPLREEAHERAVHVRKELSLGIDRGPIHGIAIGIKDLIDVAGVPTTFASRALDPVTPARSAVLVENLERAGAVIVAKTNLLEFAYGSVHPDFGQTNNPWDLSRTSGGSSGGSGAGVCVEFFDGAVGTDTGGSIRGPASYCGIAGLKPTYGLVDTQGVFPLSWSLDHAGPMARTPACTHALLDAMTGKATLGPPLPLKGMRFAVVDIHRAEPALRDDVARAFDAAVESLERAGARNMDVELPDLSRCDKALLDILLPEASVIHREIHAARAEGYGNQTRAIIETGFTSLGVDIVEANRFRHQLRGDLERVFDTVDLLLSPTVAFVAPAEDPAVAEDEGEIEMRFVAPWNLTGQPVLSMPCGFGENGLPVGLQLIGALGTDALLLRRAESLHRLLDLQLAPPILANEPTGIGS